MKVTNGLVEQHIHGAFGIDFMNCTSDDVLNCADLLAQNGVCAFFPTVMTDDLDIIKNRIETVKEAKAHQKNDTAQIVGIHLEGPFINPDKAGIHEKKYILPLNIDLYNKIDDEIIKIVTLAPEFDKSGEFRRYMKTKNIKLSLGHSTSYDFENISQVTHLYNAMASFHHRNENAVVKALCDDNIYTEIIADSMHVSDDVLKITFKQKPVEKILLISDALPMAHGSQKKGIFAGQKIFNKNGKLVNAEGTMAGSSSLLCDIVKNLADKSLMTFNNAIKCASENILKYHNIKNNMKVYWNDANTIEKVEFI